MTPAFPTHAPRAGDEKFRPRDKPPSGRCWLASVCSSPNVDQEHRQGQAQHDRGALGEKLSEGDLAPAKAPRSKMGINSSWPQSTSPPVVGLLRRNVQHAEGTLCTHRAGRQCQLHRSGSEYIRGSVVPETRSRAANLLPAAAKRRSAPPRRIRRRVLGPWLPTEAAAVSRASASASPPPPPLLPPPLPPP